MTTGGPEHNLEWLGARVDELTATVSRLMTDLEDLAHAVAPLEPLVGSETAAASVQGVDQDAAGAPLYGIVDDWVTDYFLPTFRRVTGGELRWCQRWQEHPEAVVRLDSLWRSWEALRRDDELGLVTWLTHYLDPQLHALMSRGGTFAGCTDDRHASATESDRGSIGRRTAGATA